VEIKKTLIISICKAMQKTKVRFEFSSYTKITDEFRSVLVSPLFWQNGRAAVADTKFIQSKSGINEELVV
jgi:hypothetical protein